MKENRGRLTQSHHTTHVQVSPFLEKAKSPRMALWLKSMDFYIFYFGLWLCRLCSAFWTTSTLVSFPLLSLDCYFPVSFVVFLLFFHHRLSVFSPLAHSLYSVILHLSAGPRLGVLGLELACGIQILARPTACWITVGKPLRLLLWVSLSESGPANRVVVGLNETMLAKHSKQFWAHSKCSLINGGYHCVFRTSILPHAHINHGTSFFVLSFFRPHIHYISL